MASAIPFNPMARATIHKISRIGIHPNLKRGIMILHRGDIRVGLPCDSANPSASSRGNVVGILRIPANRLYPGFFDVSSDESSDQIVLILLAVRFETLNRNAKGMCALDVGVEFQHVVVSFLAVPGILH